MSRTIDAFRQCAFLRFLFAFVRIEYFLPGIRGPQLHTADLNALRARVSGVWIELHGHPTLAAEFDAELVFGCGGEGCGEGVGAYQRGRSIFLLVSGAGCPAFALLLRRPGLELAGGTG